VYLGRVRNKKKLRRSASAWLPNYGSSKNFTATVLVDFQAARKRLRPKAARPSQLSASARALEWLRQLGTGEIESQAAIARREGLSRARVSQLIGKVSAKW
jgi:hypothetical protein